MMRCDCVSDLGDFQQFRPDMYKLPWWDRATEGWAVGSTMFEFAFFVLTVIILMNLLIAMMAE